MTSGHATTPFVCPTASRVEAAERRTRAAAIPAFVALAAAHCAAAQGPSSLDACIQRLDPQVDIGYDRISARCPDLARQLQQSSWSAWLPHGWKEPGNDLSARSLEELRNLANRELATRISARTPDVQRLNEILAEGGNTAADHKTAWQRFKTWLRAVLESREPARRESWLTRMIAHVGFSQSVLELISYAALAAVVALSGFIVLNELRAAGLLARRRPETRSHRVARTRPVETDWRAIEQAPFGERPRLLLHLIATRLRDLRILPPFGALTVRELTRAAQLPEPEDRARLTELALAAERVRFSGRGISLEGLHAPLARGRELLDRLSARQSGLRSSSREASRSDAIPP